MEKEEKVPKNKKYRWLRRTLRICLGVLLFFILLILFIRSPWGQGIIVDRVTSYVTSKTNTKVEVDKLFITYKGNLLLDGLYLEDKEKDTLLYSRKLEVDVPLWPIITGKGIDVNFLEWEGLKANVFRNDSIEGFNFQFLIDAFAGKEEEVTFESEEREPLNLFVGDIRFKDFDMNFRDDVLGMDTRLILGNLNLEIKTMDLQAMMFHIKNLEIEQADVHYFQNLPFPESEESEEPGALHLIVDQFSVKNFQANYQSVSDGITAVASLGELSANIPLVNLIENTIDVNYLGLKNSDITFNIISEKVPEIDETITETEIKEFDFEWPDWVINVNKLELLNNNLTYSVNNTQPLRDNFNADALHLKNFNLVAEDIFLGEKTTGLQLHTLSFEEASGIDLNQFTSEISLNESELNLTHLNFKANKTHLQGNISLSYFSLNELINQFENTGIQVDLTQFEVETKEALRFSPELYYNEVFMTLSKKPLRGKLALSGTLNNLNITETNINWGQSTSVKLNGSVQNALKPDNLQMDFPIFNLTSVRKDILSFVNEEELGVSIPETISLKSNFKGAPDDLTGQAVIKIPEGDIQFKGSYLNKNELAFQADVSVIELQLGKLLQNEQLGTLNLTLNAKGRGRDINTLNADIEARISSFALNDYAIKDLVIAGEIIQGEGTVKSAYKDENLDLVFETFMQLDSIAPRFVVDLDLIGADFQALGLTQKNIRGAFMLNADFKGNSESFNLSAAVQDGIVVYDNQSYLLGNLDVAAFVNPDTTSLDITNKMVDVRLRSNAGPIEFSDAIQRHIRRYLSEDAETAQIDDTLANPVNLNLRAKLSQAPIIRDVFLSNLKEMDTIDIQVDFSEANRQLNANVLMPYINYRGNEIDSLALGLQSDADNFDINFNFRNIVAGPLDIKRTSLKGSIENQILNIDFNSYFEDEKIVHFNSDVTWKNDTIRFQIDPAELIINKKVWDIPERNEIIYTENLLEFNEFSIRSEGQLFTLSSSRPEIEKDHIAISFENFSLSDFLDYFNPEDTLARGRLNGNIILEDPFGSLGLIADMEINEFNIMEVSMGTLSLEARESKAGIYDFNLALKGGEVDLDLTGDYEADEVAAKLNLDLALNEVKISAIEGFSDGEITNTEGSFSGDIKVTGTRAEPQYEGEITFDSARFTIATLNAGFRLNDESLRINNEGLYLDQFQIEDENGNDFVVHGSILTESLTNPEFDLKFNAKNFWLLNSTRKDNDLFYGTAVVDIDATLTGNLNLPRLDGKLIVGEETNVTYIMQESELAIEERDGVVIFVNREDPDDILTKTRDESYAVTGFDVSALISINEDAIFNVVIDEQTGDNFQIGGEGDLTFNINPNGRTTLSGRYTLNKGHFELNLYNLVKRRFEIADGSSIIWAGDPVDAILDIRAIYRVEAAASSLMAPSSGSFDAGMNNRFRQQLPFLVYLNIDGELMEPVLTFNLDMPKDEQGAIGGQVYGRVQQLNQQEEELNKQVFSLLVLNRFFPESGSDGSQGGAMGVARNNINQALSERMNRFSDQLLGSSGIELDFGLDTFTDYGEEGSQERTQLDITARKRLFNNRVIVSVGSEVDIQGSNQNPDEPSPVIGNVSVEYLLTENGRYRLKGFRRNQFENVIDGQLIVSGIALIFTREFDKFAELFAKAADEQLQVPIQEKEVEPNDENKDQNED